MKSRIQIIVLILLPILIIGGLFLFGQSLPTSQAGHDYVVQMDMSDEGKPVDLPKIYGPTDQSRPLVVIDAGHGGKDPGAGSGGFKEKTIVLGLAKALRDRLLEEGGIRVAMTREDDRFLVLQERPQIARKLDADLFISIHADSAGGFNGVSGASIYTLSDIASSEAAQIFAERENNSGSLNGTELGDESAEVSAILVELSQRKVQQDSSEFSDMILREGKGTLRFHPQRRRSAALAVLRAPDVPAVLYEAGYITNASDAARLASETGRDDFAEAMARSIRVFFARQSSE